MGAFTLDVNLVLNENLGGILGGTQCFFFLLRVNVQKSHYFEGKRIQKLPYLDNELP
jgi:hypothetical protein